MKEAPKGIEVLVKKAAVDPAFQSILMKRRGAAAQEIGLELEPAEVAMIEAVPAAQLAAIIGGTTVPVQYQRAFLGQAAAAMLAAVGAMSAALGADSPPNQSPPPPAVTPIPQPPPKPTPDELRTLELYGRRMNELTNRIVAIEKQIADTQSKAEASPNDRQRLLEDVRRLQKNKAELEQQLDDLRLLKAQLQAIKVQTPVILGLRLETRPLANPTNHLTPPPGANPVPQPPPKPNTNGSSTSKPLDLQRIDRRMNELTNQIVTIKKQIADTQSKAEVSPNDRQRLLEDVRRLQKNKAELEQQLDDLRLLKSQVQTLRGRPSLDIRGTRFDMPPPIVNPSNR